MNQTTIEKNGVTMEIKQQADKYGEMVVWAIRGEKRVYGKIPGNTKTVYPRIEFRFCKGEQWLHQLADHRSWTLDDYETGDDAEKRPTDNCEFVLTADEVAFLNDWRVVPGHKPEPETKARKSMDISSGFGIGGYGSDDHNMRLEQPGTSYDHSGCNWGHGTRYDEVCERCGRVTHVCNDCGRCEKCHGS